MSSTPCLIKTSLASPLDELTSERHRVHFFGDCQRRRSRKGFNLNMKGQVGRHMTDVCVCARARVCDVCVVGVVDRLAR
jgi:hypothetical protein